jgi:hypothetical protein
MNTVIEVIARAFRKEPSPTIKRVRNVNGMYARKVQVTESGKSIGYFYMPTKKGFVASGRGVK